MQTLTLVGDADRRAQAILCKTQIIRPGSAPASARVGASVGGFRPASAPASAAVGVGVGRSEHSSRAGTPAHVRRANASIAGTHHPCEVDASHAGEDHCNSDVSPGRGSSMEHDASAANASRGGYPPDAVTPSVSDVDNAEQPARCSGRSRGEERHVGTDAPTDYYSADDASQYEGDNVSHKHTDKLRVKRKGLGSPSCPVRRWVLVPPNWPW